MLGYLRTFWEGFEWWRLFYALERLAGVLVCLTVHETCHGLAAYALGDPTAKRMNRLSFNPLHHIDWLGLASMFICGFGWAKPVPVDMRYFKNPKAGMALTALAGPVVFLMTTAMLSIGLGLFNLVPIPPLDGSKVLFSLLPDRAYYTLMRFERFGMLVLLLIIWLDLGGSYLSDAIRTVYYWMAELFFSFERAG